MAPGTNSTRASDIEPQDIEWLWKERIPLGMLSLIAGRPGTSKSTFVSYLTAHTTKMGHGAILANFEDSPEHVIVPRLEAAGAKLNKVFITSWLRLPDHLEWLREEIIKRKAKLVTIDPIAACLKVSIYNDQDVRTALTPLSELAAELGCAIVMVSHVVKNVSKNAHPLQAVGGSGGGLGGAARAGFIFGVNPDDKDERILATAKFNIGEEPKGVAFEVDSLPVGDNDREQPRLICVADDWKGKAIDLVTDATAGEGGAPQKKAVAAEWLTTYLSQGERPVAELREDAAKTGFSWATLRRAADELELVKGRKGFGPGSKSVWRLPDDHPALKGASVDTDDLDDLPTFLGGDD